MLLSLLLANTKIYHAFFCLFLCWVSFFPVVREKFKVKLALAIPTGAPTTVLNKMIDTPPLLALITIKNLSM